MKLSEIKNGNLSAEWAEKGYELPKFDIEAVKAKTHAEPTWVHFGAGNIFRAFPAAILNDALNTGKYDRGVIVAESFDYEIIDKAYRPYDNMSLLDLGIRARGDLVDHAPREGDLGLVLHIGQELGGHQTLLHPLGSIGVDSVLDLIAVVGAVIHALGVQYMLGVWDLLDRLDEEKKKG